MLPMWRGEEGSYSPDGKSFAYVPNLKWQDAWKRYRGGQTTPVYIVTLSDLRWRSCRAKTPMTLRIRYGWVTRFIFFPTATAPVTIFAYDTKTKSVKQVMENKGLDLKSVSAGPDALVYEQFGGI